ncbi:hypothetical protein MtrunA17_Chr5g0397011 [Medicago truncatula]|uniref:Uncharacterized protein n=1 Tax=Medicago truncatula TaxID=3880 RepID=A0A396HS38_MEDTR|nr:hypothetical protein MtrunA17_Chr5g0397011 [Medicago truncatula]
MSFKSKPSFTNSEARNSCFSCTGVLVSKLSFWKRFSFIQTS